jgi:MFS family permease
MIFGLPSVKCYPIAVASLAVLIAGVFVPTPLYELYRREWGLSPGAIGMVFGVYAGSAIPSLLFFGGISDRIGRPRGLLLAFGLAALAAITFALASGVWWLAAGRILQGLSIGIGTPTATAALREWMDATNRARAGILTIVGTGVGAICGALASGMLGQYASFPMRLPFLVLLAFLAGLSLVVATVPHCPQLAPAAHTEFPSVPAEIRRPFFVASAASFMGWSATGIFASLLPSFLENALHNRNLLIGGMVVTGLQFGMLAAAFGTSRLSNRATVIGGLLAMGVGFWTLLVGVQFQAYGLLGVAVFVAGIGAGAVSLAGVNIINDVAAPQHRAELFSLFLSPSYLGFTVPVLCIGFVANSIGLYGAIVGSALVLGAIGVVLMLSTTEHNLHPAVAATTAAI